MKSNINRIIDEYEGVEVELGERRDGKIEMVIWASSMEKLNAITFDLALEYQRQEFTIPVQTRDGKLWVVKGRVWNLDWVS